MTVSSPKRALRIMTRCHMTFTTLADKEQGGAKRPACISVACTRTGAWSLAESSRRGEKAMPTGPD